MQQQNQRTTRGLEAGLQHVYVETVDVPREAGANSGSQSTGFEGCHLGHARLLGPDRLPTLAENAWNESASGVESRCGAVAVGRTYLLPRLSFGGASLARPWLRFPTHRAGWRLIHPSEREPQKVELPFRNLADACLF